MNPYYYDELPVSVGEEELLMVLGVILAIVGVILVLALVFALLRSWGLYTIAKRRGIRHAWLSWIPVGKDWILGSVSDQYQHLALGQVKSRRKILMVLHLASFCVALLVGALSMISSVAAYNGADTALVSSLTGMIPGLVNGVIGIAAAVFYHMCNYDLYRSCDPKNAVVYLVIGILIPITEPFFYLAVRKRDDGMPRPQTEQPYM